MSGGRRGRHGAAVAAVTATVALVLVACSATAPTPASSAGRSPAPSPTGSWAVDVPDPGRPFRAADIRAAMASSVRPGGVPADLQTNEVAAAVAEALWTFDGSPWPAIAAGGSCGPDACTLELAGRAAGAAGEDVWVLRVDPTMPSVDVETADLHAIPASLADRLDAHARAAEGAPPLDGLVLTSVRWRPPPDAGVFVLAYRSGNEEGSCSVDVEVDARSGDVTATDARGC